MWDIIAVEIMKLKRYFILWIGLALMLLTVLITLFTSTADTGIEWTFQFFGEQVTQILTTTTFPVSITLISGYLINREVKDDVLKSIYPIPLSFRKMLCGKLIVCGFLSMILGLACATFTVILNLIAGFPGLTVQKAFLLGVQMMFVNLFIYLAVLPIIAFTAKKEGRFLPGVIVAFIYGYMAMFVGSSSLQSAYPINASLVLIRYRSADMKLSYNMLQSICSMAIVLALTAIIVLTAKKNNSHMRKENLVKDKTKKGW